MKRWIVLPFLRIFQQHQQCFWVYANLCLISKTCFRHLKWLFKIFSTKNTRISFRLSEDINHARKQGYNVINSYTVTTKFSVFSLYFSSKSFWLYLTSEIRFHFSFKVSRLRDEMKHENGIDFIRPQTLIKVWRFY